MSKTICGTTKSFTRTFTTPITKMNARKTRTKNDATQHQRQEMIARTRQPSHAEGEGNWNTEEQDDSDDNAQAKQDLPHKVSERDISTPAPELANPALPGQHAVKENEAHPAAHVDERNYNNHDQQSQQAKRQDKEKAASERKVHPLKNRALLSGRARRKPSAESATGSQFTCKKSHDRQPEPLAEPERPEEMLLHPLESRADDVYCGKWHGERYCGKV